MGFYTCPSVLPDMPNMGCSVKYGQIQKIAFQRIGHPLSDIREKSAWTAALASTSVDKIVVTPYVESPEPDGGDERTFGSGNEVRDGIEYVMGINPVKMTFQLRNYQQRVIRAMKHLTTFQDLGVYFFTQNGIIAMKDGSNYVPIPIRAMFVGDLLMHGLAQPDRNILSFRFKANYSDYLEVVVPNFNPIEELMNADHYIGDGSFSRAFNFSFDV